MLIERRRLLQTALALPLIAANKAPPGADWSKWFDDYLKRDFGMVSYYADENAKLLASKTPVDVVFMGDSITEGWKDKRPTFFSTGRVDRGISGQTTSQMVLRMISDVVALRPKAVHLMAGTNDIAGNTGPMAPVGTMNNFRAMSDIARRNGIRVIIASIPPAASFPWRSGLETRKPIADLNRWLKSFAAQTGAIWVDYHTVLDDGTGAMKLGMAYDGVHPSEAGYDAMATVINPVLARVIGSARHR